MKIPKVSSVDEYITHHKKDEKILESLRAVLLQSGLKEEIKWSMPTYTMDKKNLIGLAAFKEFVAIWFHQGVFLSDPEGVLINALEGTTKGLRQWRIEHEDEVDEKLLKSYVEEAIQNHKEGKEIKPEKKPLIIPDILQEALEDSEIGNAFEAFNLTKKREFVYYIDSAKQEATKRKRLEKIRPMIVEGVGLGDKYQK